MAVKISERESQIIELLRIGEKPHRISVKLNKPIGSLYATLNRLIYLGFVKKLGYVTYVPLIENYEISDENTLKRMRYEKLSYSTFDTIHPVFPVEVTPSIRSEIEKYYIQHRNQRIIRSELVKALGIPRYLLNVEVISMGLEQLVPEDNDYAL